MSGWTGRRMLTTVLVTALAAGVGVVAGGGPAAAYAAETRAVVTSTIPTNYDRKVILRLPAATLQAEDPVQLYGHYAATSRWLLLQAAQIVCTSSAGTFRSAFSTTNNLGQEYDHPGETVIRVRWLFTPPATASYTCVLEGWAAHKFTPKGKYLTVVPGPNTLLRRYHARPGGEEWRDPADHVPPLDYDRPGTPVREAVKVVLRKHWTPRTPTFDVVADVQLSSRVTGGSRPFVARAELWVTPVDAAYQPCADPAIKTTTREIPGVLHHLKVHLTLSKLTRQTSGSCTGSVGIKVVVWYLPHPSHPSPTRHGGQVEGGYYTTAYAMERP